MEDLENQNRTPGSDVEKLSLRIYLLPNLVTAANLLCGVLSILYSIQGNFLAASYAMVLAAVFDQLDGRLARLTRATSRFGAEFDSLCDLVSFGVAPGMLLYLWALEPFGRVGALAFFLMVVCAALRLARFNVQAHIVEKAYFQGLPSPISAGIVASSVLAFQDWGIEAKGNRALLAMSLLLSLAMVSTFRYRSFKDLDFKSRMPFVSLMLGIGLIVLVGIRWETNLFLLFLTYAVLGAAFGIFRLGKSKIRPNVYLPSRVLDDPDLVEDEVDLPEKPGSKSGPQ